MFDKKRLKKVIIIILLIIFIILLAIFIRRTLSRYETDANFKRDLDVAFFITDNSFQSDTAAIEDMAPSDTPYEYEFTVSNYEGSKRTETSLEYELTITTTTNLPLTYTLTKNGTECEIEQEIITDSDGIYYKKITVKNTDTNNLEFGFSQKQTDTFILYVTFPETQNDVSFADLIEVINIDLEAQQII